MDGITWRMISAGADIESRILLEAGYSEDVVWLAEFDYMRSAEEVFDLMEEA